MFSLLLPGVELEDMECAGQIRVARVSILTVLTRRWVESRCVAESRVIAVNVIPT